MDATLQGYNPAMRQSWATTNASGSAEIKGIIPPPKIHEAPTFRHYTTQAQLFLINTGNIPASDLRSERTFLFLITNTGPGFNRGSGGGARGCGFKKQVGAYART